MHLAGDTAAPMTLHAETDAPPRVRRQHLAVESRVDVEVVVDATVPEDDPHRAGRRVVLDFTNGVGDDWLHDHHTPFRAGAPSGPAPAPGAPRASMLGHSTAVCLRLHPSRVGGGRLSHLGTSLTGPAT